jgi:hypothetical protein
MVGWMTSKPKSGDRAGRLTTGRAVGKPGLAFTILRHQIDRGIGPGTHAVPWHASASLSYEVMEEQDPAPSTFPCLRRPPRVLHSGWWPPDAVVAALIAWHRRFGTSPTKEDFTAANRVEYPHPSTVAQVMGGWNRALEAAGLPLNRTHPPRPRWSDRRDPGRDPPLVRGR